MKTVPIVEKKEILKHAITSSHLTALKWKLSGKNLCYKAFINIKLAEFMKTIKNNPKTQKGIELIVRKSSNKSYKTQSQIGKMP